MNGAPYKLDFGIETDQQKTTIRKRMLAELRALKPAERKDLSSKLLQHLVTTRSWKDADSVLIFHPLKSEPDIKPLLEDSEPSVFLPRVTPEGLDIYQYTGSNSLRRSEFGMLEPDPEKGPPASISRIDLAIIPGLAFAPSTGVRLGRGGGYYDRLLSDPDFRAIKLGICFGFQIRSQLPFEAHDQRVDQVVSDCGEA